MFYILTINSASEKPYPVTVDVHSSAVIEYRDVPHPDHKFSHLEMLILAACGLTKSAGA